MARADGLPTFVWIGALAIGCGAPDVPLHVPDAPLLTSETTRSGAPGASGSAAPVEPAVGTSEVVWTDATQSPWPPVGDPREIAIGSACGEIDGAIARVARRLADERARGLGTEDADTVASMLLAEGEPHPRPRVLSAAGKGPLDDAWLRKKLTGLRRIAPSRCGIAIARTAHGGEVVVAIVVDALADLAPLPVRARTGEWLSFDARLATAAEGARLVVLGPRGAPRTVPTALDKATGHARARFALDRPGAFRVQLVADGDGGPRPVLEAEIFADVAPPTTLAPSPAPGEEAGSLGQMIAELRASENLPALVPDRDLDALARAHAERMRDEATLAHDVGEGDPRARVEAEGLPGTAIAENVAHAATVALAHRALHASPSHRVNLLNARATHLGIGIAQAPDGSVYICELFATRPTPLRQ